MNGNVYYQAPVLSGKNADGSCKGDTDIPGSGQQAGEECVENYAPVPYLRAGAFLVLHF